MSRLDEYLPEYDVSERHERRVPATPDLAVAAALGAPVAPDALVRTLFRLRGLPGGGSVLGAAGRPWAPRGGRLVPFDRAGPGQVRLLLELAAMPDGAEWSRLATETRVAAVDAGARRTFRRYWLAVGPFSALIRRRWLAAAERALR
jgi:hypothetical protein